MKKIKILSKFITILSASFLICSNFNAMKNTDNKNLKTNNINKNKPICKKDIMKNPFEKDILTEKQNPNDDENNNVLLNKKRNNPRSSNKNEDCFKKPLPINNNMQYNKQKPDDDYKDLLIEKQNLLNNKQNSNTEKTEKIENKDNDEKTLRKRLEFFYIPFPEYFNHITNDSLFDFIDNSKFAPTTEMDEEIKKNEDLKENRNYLLDNIDGYIDHFITQNHRTSNLKNFVENCLKELNEYDIHNTSLQSKDLSYSSLIREIFLAKQVSYMLTAIARDYSIIIEDEIKLKIFNLQRIVSNYIDNLENISINLEEYFKKLYDDGLDSKHIADPSLNMIKYCLGMLTTEQNEDADKKLIATYYSIYYTNNELLGSASNENKIRYLYSKGEIHNLLYTSLVSFISYLDHEINIQNKKIYSKKNKESAQTLIKNLYLILENFEKILNFEMTICENCEKYINDYVENIKERISNYVKSIKDSFKLEKNLKNPELLPHIQDAKTYNNFVKDTSTQYINMIAKLKKQLKKQYLECEKPKNVPFNIKIKNDKSPLVFPQNSNNVNVNVNESKNYNFNILSNNLNSYDNNKFSNNDLNKTKLREINEHSSSFDDHLLSFVNEGFEKLNNPIKSAEQQKNDGLKNNSLDLPLDNKVTSQLNILNSNQKPPLNQQSNYYYDSNNNNIIFPNNPIYNNISDSQLNNLNDVKSAEQQKDDGLDLLLDNEVTSQLNDLNLNQKLPLNQQLSYTNMIPFSNDYIMSLSLSNSEEYHTKEYYNNIFKLQLNNLNDVKFTQQEDNNLNLQLNNKTTSLLNNLNLNQTLPRNQQSNNNNNIKFSDNKLNIPNNPIYNNMSKAQLNNLNNVKSAEQKNINKNLYNPLKYEKYNLQDLKKVTDFSLDEEDYANQKDNEKIKTSNQINEDFSTINLSEWLNKQSFNKIYEKLIKHFNYFFNGLTNICLTIKNLKENNYLNLKYLEFMQNSKTSMQLYDYYNCLYSYSVILDILVSLSDNYYDLFNLLYEVSNDKLNMNNKIDENKIKFLKEKLIPLIEYMKNQLKDAANMFHNIVEKEFPLEKIYSIEDLLDNIFANNGEIFKEIYDKSIINDIKNAKKNISRYPYFPLTTAAKNNILGTMYGINKKYEFFLQNRLKFIYLEKSLKFKKNFLESVIDEVISTKFQNLLESKNFLKNNLPDLLKELSLFISQFLKTEILCFFKAYNNNNNRLLYKKNFFNTKIEYYATKSNNNFDLLYNSHKKLEENKQKIENNQNIKDDKNIKENFSGANIKLNATKNNNNFGPLYNSYNESEKDKQKTENNQNIKDDKNIKDSQPTEKTKK